MVFVEKYSNQEIRLVSISVNFIEINKDISAFLQMLEELVSKTSQELRMLSRSLSDCQSTIQIAVSVVIVVIVVIVVSVY